MSLPLFGSQTNCWCPERACGANPRSRQGTTGWSTLALPVMLCHSHDGCLLSPAVWVCAPSLFPYMHCRGLKSFRSSPWDAREGLPAEYGRVFAFENFKRTAKRAREAAVSLFFLQAGERCVCMP